MPSTINGNILVGMCTTHGWYWDSGGDTSDTLSANGARGLIFFQDHSQSGLTSYYGGNGSFAFAGGFYIHSSDYSSIMALQGTSGNGTFIMGAIVTDYLQLGGNGIVSMLLNGTPYTPMLKVALVQ